MNPPPAVFAQILAGVDPNELIRTAARFPMPRALRSLSVYDHFAAMIFAQLAPTAARRQVCSAVGLETSEYKPFITNELRHKKGRNGY